MSHTHAIILELNTNVHLNHLDFSCKTHLRITMIHCYAMLGYLYVCVKGN